MSERAAQPVVPRVDLRHLQRMTDDTGLFQHAKYHVPDAEHGYCIDDNARALIAAVLYEHLHHDGACAELLDRYLAFVVNALNKDGCFRNFMSYERRWLEDVGSDDSHCRALWSLGVASRFAPSERVKELAEVIFDRALPAVARFEHVHPMAYTLVALDERLAASGELDACREQQRAIGDRFYEVWRSNAGDGWPWWVNMLTWGNAKLPHALLVTGRALGRDDMVDAALRSLRWCIDVQTAPEGHLSVIGNAGWLTRSGHHAKFDQQAIEAQCLVQAALAAAEVTGDEAWLNEAHRSYTWFTGRNDLGLSLIDEDTGGIYDGLQPEGLNKNQGAESYLAHLLAALELQLYDQRHNIDVHAAPAGAIGFAVVGASRFAQFCLRQYRQLDGIEPVGVWSRTHESASRFAAENELHAYDDLPALLADARIDLLHIATTPASHAELAGRCLRAGKHVLIEKPIATSLADARQVLSLAAEHDRALAVNLMMRYGPLVEPVKTLITTGLLGAPLRGSFTNYAGDGGLPADHWFWDTEQSGGIFIEHGVHSFDLLRHWLGDGRTLAAHQQQRPGTTIVDQATAEVGFGTQTTVNFYHGFTQNHWLDRQRMRLLFERGELRLDGWIAGDLQLIAVLSDEQIEQVAALLAGAQIETLRRLPGDRPVVGRRGRNERADAEVRISWSGEDDKQTLYGRAVRDLMADLTRRIANRRHRMRVTPDDAVAALQLAADADELARRV